MKLAAFTQNRSVRLLKATVENWIKDKALRLSAAMAFYAIFSIGPLLVIAVGIAGLVLGPEAVRGHLEDQLREYAGAHAAESIQSMVKSAAKPGQGVMATVVGFIMLLVGASGVFGQLKDALNTIWEVKAKPGVPWKDLILERLLGFGMVLIIGFLLLTSLVVTTTFAAVTHYLDHILYFPSAFWTAVSLGISFCIATLLFAVIFKVLPDASIQWRHVWTGAAVTAALFEAGKFGLSFYLGRESTASAYGAAGAVVLLLLWVYYSSCILFFGAEFTRVYATEMGNVVKPAENACPVTAEQRAEEGLDPAPKAEDGQPLSGAATRHSITG